MRKLCFILLVGSLLASCNSDKAHQERIAGVEEEYGTNSYEASFVYMGYLMNRGKDLEYSLKLVNKLISNKRFTEARYALSRLSEAFLDYRLYYLKAVCYRNEIQFEEAEVNIRKAMKISQNEILNDELENIKEDFESWKRVEKIERQIKEAGLDTELRIRRAEALIHAGYTLAAFLDLDTLISRGTQQDEAYYLKIRANTYLKEYQEADSILHLWREIVSDKWLAQLDKLSYSLKGIREVQPKISSGQASPGDYLLMARYLTSLSDYVEAERLILQGLIRYPEDLSLSYALLLVYTESEQNENARKISLELKEIGVKIPAEIEKYLESK